MPKPVTNPVVLLALTAWVGLVFYLATRPVPEFSTYALVKTKVYFSNAKMGSAQDCSLVFPVNRRIAGEEPFYETSTELLRGPTEEEAKKGYLTTINPGVKILSISVKDRTAYADFSRKIEYQLGGSCRVQAIRAQINETLKQFPAIKEVIISVEGQTEDVLQP